MRISGKQMPGGRSCLAFPRHFGRPAPPASFGRFMAEQLAVGSDAAPPRCSGSPRPTLRPLRPLRAARAERHRLARLLGISPRRLRRLRSNSASRPPSFFQARSRGGSDGSAVRISVKTLLNCCRNSPLGPNRGESLRKFANKFCGCTPPASPRAPPIPTPCGA